MSHPSQQQTDSRPTYKVEDYLMIMYVMERDYGEIIAARISRNDECNPSDRNHDLETH